MDLSPEAYEELVGHTVDVLTVLDESGRIRYESPSIERVFGYAPDGLIGENGFEYVHPGDCERAVEKFAEVIDASGEYTTGAVELRFRHADGSWLWVESRGSNQATSSTDGYVVVSRDISDRKEYERKLERERDRLERFTSIVSHDLRNPLNIADGRVQLAREDCESDHLDAAARALERMDTLIDDILMLTREGWAEPDLETVDLGETLRNCWDNLETGDATVAVETDAVIRADRGQLQRLLENLVRNSVEHGGPGITATVGALQGGFYVADDGVGLPDDDRESLLEYGVSTTRNGTGLGLAIVSAMVETHGWEFALGDSESGVARFEITGVTFADGDGTRRGQ